MSYTVIARNWRPQKLDEVVGQRAVTQTLRNAIASGRIAQAFVFAGPRGVGKTTTARILARALNCVKGPTPDPCGACDACLEIAEGRDMDVLEIDAATHTGIDNVREVIIAGLAIMPVRDRYKIFIIDEVHQLSGHVVQRAAEVDRGAAAARRLHHGDDRRPTRSPTRSCRGRRSSSSGRSRARRSPSSCEDRRRRRHRRVADEALALVARVGRRQHARRRDGASTRSSRSPATTITVEDVATVLGLVGRDLLLRHADGGGRRERRRRRSSSPAAPSRPGYDLRLLCRELSRLVRDLLVLSVDPSRITRPRRRARGRSRAAEGAAPARFSREDLLRAFDVLTRAESDIRDAAEPRYHLEMALLRWIHLRKLVPLADADRPARERRAARGGRAARVRRRGRAAGAARPQPPSSASVARELAVGAGAVRPGVRVGAAPPASRRSPAARATGGPVAAGARPPTGRGRRRPAGRRRLKDAFLAAIAEERPCSTAPSSRRRSASTSKAIAIIFRFGASPDDAGRPGGAAEGAGSKRWRSERAGRRITVVADVGDGRGAGGRRRAATACGASAAAGRGARATCGREALKDPVVQALLDVFPAEIKDVTELK